MARAVGQDGHARIDEARRDGIDPDAVAGEVAGERAGEIDDAALGGGIGEGIPRAAQPHDGGDIEHRGPCPSETHERQQGEGDENGAVEVDVDHLAVAIEGQLVDGGGIEDGGVVDQYVDASIGGLQRMGECRDGAFIADIHGKGGSLAACLDDRRDHGLGPAAVDIGDGDGRPLGGEAPGDALADPLRPTGHQSDAAGQTLGRKLGRRSGGGRRRGLAGETETSDMGLLLEFETAEIGGVRLRQATV